MHVMTPDSIAFDRVRAIAWAGDRLRLLDQRRLPQEVVYVDVATAADAAAAIRDMVVRGAPAIGITAAYAVVLAARARRAAGATDWRAHLEADLDLLARARPTAVNLAWALARMRAVLERRDDDVVPALLAEAQRIQAEDLAANHAMGMLGARFIAPGSGVLTHCNTGALATAGYGTALGVIRAGYAQGRIARVFAGETRPWLQGARLTAWELAAEGIPATLIADGAGAHLMRCGEVGWVIVGADRVAANGDTANKIGTYSLAIAARHHGVRVMVVAPLSSVDRATASGADIAIEDRPEDELLHVAGHRHTPAAARAWNPAFDVTPAALIDVLVTEKGAIERPDTRAVSALFDAV